MMINVEKIEFLKSLWAIKPFKCAIEVVAAIVVFWAIIKTVNFFVRKVLTKVAQNTTDFEFKKHIFTVKNLVVSTLDTVLIVMMCFQILNIIGIDIRPFLAAAGVVGVAIGFGAKSFVEDIITGLTILLTGQIRVGDWVEIGTSVGIVQKVNIRMIVLRDLKGNVHYISNRLVDKVINYTQEFSYAVFDVDVAYKEDIRRVIEVLKDLGVQIKKHETLGKFVLDNLEMFGLDSFESSSIRIKCRIKTHPAHKLDVFREFNLMIKERFDKEGIEIPFTQVTVHQPNM